MASVRRVNWPGGSRAWRAPLVRVLGYVCGWALLAVPVAYHGFFTDTRETVIAGHDAVVSPARDSYATVDLGAYLPNVRYPTDQPLGVSVEVGKTNLDNYDQLLERYALIGSHPEGEIRKVSGLVRDMLVDNVVKGALIGLAVPLAWVIVGRERRRQIAHEAKPLHLALGVACLAVVVVASASVPWNDPRESGRVADEEWQPISELLPGTPIPVQAATLEVQGGLITSGTKSLVESALSSYETSQTYYRELAGRVHDIEDQLRQPEEDETVALMVTDRHDNVGMDAVARALFDAAGATVLLDAGDDTSTGQPWEAFSLDSLDEAFDDVDHRYVAPGNHDEGSFVADHFEELGFTVLSGTPVDVVDGITLLGAPDPRSSGLGNWRTTKGATIKDVSLALADTACEHHNAGERVNTLLVHDSSLGEDALQRGCVDLVLAGHLHTQVGPEQIVGLNGEVGVAYTNGTTGGAAYAVALGTRLRRDAQMTLVTYRDGRPVGLQPVVIKTNAVFVVSPYIPLPLGSDEAGP